MILHPILSHSDSHQSFVITVIIIVTLLLGCSSLLGRLLLFLLVLALPTCRFGQWPLKDLQDLFILDLLI
jgi:hypothetical protein